MNTKKNKGLTTAMIIIAVAAILYCPMPDPLFGPVDDAAVITLAAIAETVLGIINARNKAVPEFSSNGFDEYFKE